MYLEVLEKSLRLFQCFDTRTYTCVHVTNLPSPCKASKAITLHNRIYVITPEGEVLSFGENGDMKVVTVINDFSRVNFGVCVSNEGMFVLGGEPKSMLDVESVEVNNDVVYIGENALKVQDYIQNIPVPMAVYGCVHSVIRQKYPLVEYEKLY
ncbi:LOW QUALITY PROTEIN: hypothetical protein KUTeg_003980 [Tegillarca granosa]|uniref:Uncharacterized protein n=1 Tax=Tegillarca granosa TaxID=220873 RepID=A0ABQ9FNK4_TEGGR|nr:LOW QUALITY PROTEIN: hypothetical protein KUTeg_003980 [Tegillarca granosa]